MTLSGLRPLTLPILLAAALVLGVLYGIMRGPVHAPGPVPPSLSRLTMAKTPTEVPEVAFFDAVGKRHTLSEYRGRYVLLNLWATWCAPCVRELPALAALARGFPRNRLAIVAVDVGRDSDSAARDFLANHAAGGLPLFVDSDIALVRSFRAYGLPLTVLIDPDGREIGRAVGGADWDAPDAVAYLERVVAPPSPCGRGCAG